MCAAAVLMPLAGLVAVGLRLSADTLVLGLPLALVGLRLSADTLVPGLALPLVALRLSISTLALGLLIALVALCLPTLLLGLQLALVGLRLSTETSAWASSALAGSAQSASSSRMSASSMLVVGCQLEMLGPCVSVARLVLLRSKSGGTSSPQVKVFVFLYSCEDSCAEVSTGGVAPGEVACNGGSCWSVGARSSKPGPDALDARAATGALGETQGR